MKRLLIFFRLILVFLPSFTYADDPKGWEVLLAEIKKTNISDVSSLRDRSFDMVVPGGTYEYDLQVVPKNVFKIERLGSDKFRVTIVNPEFLVNREKPIVKYYSIGWSLAKNDHFQAAILGDVNCRYEAVFRQEGVGQIDLKDFKPSEYEVTYEFSNPAAIVPNSVKRYGRGYEMMRVSNSTAETSMRLRIKEIAGTDDLMTGWIKIPACATNESNPTISQPPQATTAPPPLPPAMNGFGIKVTNQSVCEDEYGRMCVTLFVTATNSGPQKIRCDMVYYLLINNKKVYKNPQWVEVAANNYYNFQVVLKSTGRRSYYKYEFETEGCYYK